jgi:hypothetical protein
MELPERLHVSGVAPVEVYGQGTLDVSVTRQQRDDTLVPASSTRGEQGPHSRAHLCFVYDKSPFTRLGAATAQQGVLSDVCSTKTVLVSNCMSALSGRLIDPAKGHLYQQLHEHSLLAPSGHFTHGVWVQYWACAGVRKACVHQVRGVSMLLTAAHCNHTLSMLRVTVLP